MSAVVAWEAERVTWVKTADDHEIQYAKVNMKLDGGTWKVDRVQVQVR